jgi:hypothetical protein
MDELTPYGLQPARVPFLLDYYCLSTPRALDAHPLD